MNKWIIVFSLAICVLGCSKNPSKHTLKVAATAVPHAEILEHIKPLLEKEGVDLEIIVVEDYNTPNRALADKDVDANFFQHDPFLESQKKEFGYKIHSFAKVHLEPMALYSYKINSLDSLKEGDIVAIPNDPTNEARALELLESVGLIKLNRHDTQTSLLNITENPKKLKFLEIDSPLLTRALEDVSLAAITTNFALQAGLSPEKSSLAIESGKSLFVNVLVIRDGEDDREDLKKLKQAINSDDVKEFIESKYKGAVIPAFY